MAKDPWGSLSPAPSAGVICGVMGKLLNHYVLVFFCSPIKQASVMAGDLNRLIVLRYFRMAFYFGSLLDTVRYEMLCSRCVYGSVHLL